MAASISSSHTRITRQRLNPHHTAVSFDDLVLMLEIDLKLSHRANFRRRLRRALKDAYRQGLKR